jgi:hypothetical protein
VDRESVVLLVVGILSVTLGVGVLIVFRRTMNWDITVREVAGIPGAFTFAGAIAISAALDARFMGIAFGLCLIVSQIAGMILRLRRATAHDRMQKMSKK